MRETVALIGGPETGKTTFLVQLAVNNPNHPVYIFDTEDKVERVASFFGGIPDNVLVMRTPTFDEMQKAKREIVIPALRNAPRDFGIVMFDMVGNVWTEAQEKFAGLGHKEGLGANLPDQMAELRKQHKNAMTGGFEGFQGDWKTIRGWYNFVVRHTVTHMECHVFATAGNRPLRRDEGGRSPVVDHPQLVDVWNSFGSAPEGEKGLTFLMNTCLGVRAWGLVRQYELTLAKDVSRVPMLPVELWAEDVKPHTQVELKRKSGKIQQVPIYDLWQQYCDLTDGTDTKLPGGASKPIKVNSDGSWELKEEVTGEWGSR